MKNFFLLGIMSVIISVLFHVGAYGDCDPTAHLASALDGCLGGTDLVNASGDMNLEGGIKNQIIEWTLAIGQLLGLIAVGAIVLGGLMMTISLGEEERVKKGKDIVKWALLGFLALVMTGALIRVVIEVIFDVAS